MSIIPFAYKNYSLGCDTLRVCTSFITLNQQNVFVQSVDADHTGYSHSLIRVFAIRIVGNYGLNLSPRGLKDSDHTELIAQPHCCFSHAMVNMKCNHENPLLVNTKHMIFAFDVQTTDCLKTSYLYYKSFHFRIVLLSLGAVVSVLKGV